jgi:hypothetical protein
MAVGTTGVFDDSVVARRCAISTMAIGAIGWTIGLVRVRKGRHAAMTLQAGWLPIPRVAFVQDDRCRT